MYLSEDMLNVIINVNVEWIWVEMSFVSTCKGPYPQWLLHLTVCMFVCECLKVIIIGLFTCWRIISSWNSTRASTSCSKCRTGVAPLQLAWKQWTSVLHAHAISITEDRLPNIMDDQHESLASIYDFQDCGGGTGVWQDHTEAVLFREDRPVWLRLLKIEKACFQGGQLSQRTHLL